MSIIQKVIGNKNDREIKKMMPRVARIGTLEEALGKLSDDELARRLGEIRTSVDNALKAKKKPIHEIDKKEVNQILDGVLDETFAIVRDAAKRVLGMRHYDVQMVGGMVLNTGQIAEMKTGEGKTLVATLPAVLNALVPGGVHVVTVNDYLASRDAEWMGRIYRFLGLSVGVVVPRQGDRLKREAYKSDITYGQNNEFGFDYLRDNMKYSLSDYMQPGHSFCIVDEVDSILIDEARTPLIISGQAEDASEHLIKCGKIVPQLRKDVDYTIEEAERQVLFTEAGVDKTEKLLGINNLYDPDHIRDLHHMNNALRAHALWRRDVDYVIEGGKVVIVDEHTGRLMHGRRWSDGLHGAIEAKERVNIQAENRTLATITFQNYFRMYRKLSGMTGTADTEATEFAQIYNLDVRVIPTNRPIVRDDQNDLVYKSEGAKVQAVIEDIRDHNGRGVPILVGTTSVEKSEVLSRGLKKLQIGHEVLNAKRHKDEAGIVAQAGRPGRVTIATNMAGRGTDILLGGNPEFMAREEVARKLGQTEDQLAEFAFLIGREELENGESLARADMKLAKYFVPYYRALEEAKENGENASSLPQTKDEISEAIFKERTEFYNHVLSAYDGILPKFEKAANVEKGQVKDAGGLRIIGTERHESRRIDNQLRGRAGRQGDPGSSRFYLSLDDDLMRLFGSEKMVRMMEVMGMEDDVPIEHKMVSKSIENAQKRVEGMHFDSRKNVIEYDDVMNQQRKAIYSLRRRILEADPNRERDEFDIMMGEEHDEEAEAAALKEAEAELREMIYDLAEAAILVAVQNACPEKVKPQDWKIADAAEEVHLLMGVHVDLTGVVADRDEILDRIWSEVERYYQRKEEDIGYELMRAFESGRYLSAIDDLWKEHLNQMDHLREGIWTRSWGQKDPKQEYKKEGFNLFLSLNDRIRDKVLDEVFKLTPLPMQEISARKEQQRRDQKERSKKQTLGRSDSPDGAPASGGGAQAGMRTQSAKPARPFGSGGGDDDDRSMNRAERRRLKAKKRKGQRAPRA